MTPFAAELAETINTQEHIGHNQLLTFVREIHLMRDILWERGLQKVLSALKTRYFSTTNETGPQAEWTNAVRWTVGSEWSPHKVPALTAQEYARTLVLKVEPDPMAEFWQSRESLKAIHKLGRQTLTAPTSLLGICVIRALHTVPYYIHYRSFVGSAPLNTLLSVTGPTGTGKTQSSNIVDEFLIFPDADPLKKRSNTWTGTISPGSGEAMPDCYMTSRKAEDEDGKTIWIKDWAHPNHAVIFSFDEIGMMEKRGSRDGSTLTEYLKQGWSGSEFGRALTGGKGIELPKKTYRFSAVLNVQPERAGVIFTEAAIAGGFSSRFLFVSTQDKKAKKERDRSEKTPYRFSQINWDGVTEFAALPSMDSAHEKEREMAIDGGIPEMDSHRLLTRAKVTVALAVLDGRSYLVDEDWRLSGIVMQHSDETRKTILDALAQAARSENSKRGKSAGLREAAAVGASEDARYKIIRRRLEEHRLQKPHETDGVFNRTVRYDERHLAKKAAQELGPRPTAP